MTITCDKCGATPTHQSVILPGSLRMATGDKDLCEPCYAAYVAHVNTFFVATES